MKRPLIIRSYGLVVRKEGSSLAVYSKEGKRKIPLGVIDFIVVFPGVEVSASALKLLSKNKRCVFFVTQFLKPLAWLKPWELESSQANLKKCQFLLFDRESTKLTVELLKRKLIKAEKEFPSLKRELQRIRESLKKAADLNQLNALDGQIGKLLYGELAKMVKPPFKLTGRNYYPPEDPVNAVLSFNFSLFTKLLTCAISSKGLEPFYGFFHQRRGSHPSLASDLIELSRPATIKFTGELFKGEFFKPEDFKTGTRGVQIEKEAIERIMKLLFTLEAKDSLIDPSLSFLNWLIKWVREKCSS